MCSLHYSLPTPRRPPTAGFSFSRSPSASGLITGAMLAAIRRASSLLSNLAAESAQSLIWTDAGLFAAAGAGAISAGLSLGSGLADEASEV